MNIAEAYAVNLAADGITDAVDGDMFHGAGAHEGRQLAHDIADTVRGHQSEFLAWYRSVKLAEAVR